MNCRCNDVEVLDGREAQDYADHLRQLKVDPVNWETLYECPITGKHWLETFPQSNLHGGGPPRLTRTD
jgi:hypothetical protein